MNKKKRLEVPQVDVEEIMKEKDYLVDYTNLDYKVKDTQGRIDVVRKILDKQPELEERFYNFNNGMVLGSTQKIYSETNLAYTLEQMATYILQADTAEQKKILNGYEKDIENVEQMPVRQTESGTAEADHIPHYQFDDSRKYINHSKYIEEIERNPFRWGTKKDDIAGRYTLRQSDFDQIPELHILWTEYQRILKLKNCKGRSKALGSVLSQMIGLKLSILKPIQFQNMTRTYKHLDTYDFDFTDKKQVKELLYIYGTRNDLNEKDYLDYIELFIIFEDLLSNIELSKDQQKVFDLLYLDETHKVIAEIMGVSQPNISKSLNGIIEKTVEEYQRKYLGIEGKEEIQIALKMSSEIE